MLDIRFSSRILCCRYSQEKNISLSIFLEILLKYSVFFYQFPLLHFTFVSHEFYLWSKRFHIKHTSIIVTASQVFYKHFPWSFLIIYNLQYIEIIVRRSHSTDSKYCTNWDLIQNCNWRPAATAEMFLIFLMHESPSLNYSGNADDFIEPPTNVS
jgi:hypothetical protein